MPGHAQALDHTVEIEQLEVRPACDLLRGRGRNHADLGLGLRQRHFDVQPRLPARLACEELADARVSDA